VPWAGATEPATPGGNWARMPRKLKVYQTSLGFYDLAVAAPSMKAALRAWGTSENLFQQGFAKESEDNDIITAAMAQPGRVLRRPVGSTKRFQEHAELPTAESLAEHFKRTEVPRKKTTAPKSTKTEKRADRNAAERAKSEAVAKADERAERKAAAAFEKEERKRELQRKKEEAAAAKVRARRHTAIERAKSALENARREHNERTVIIEKERAATESRATEEERRWQKLKSRLEAALQKANR
jgi:colicin import membrane protein